MKEQYFSLIKNPMTIIALFVGLTEVGFGLILSNIDAELHSYLLFFLILFPTLCAIGFFTVLYFRPHHFYSPTDFRKDESYIKINERINIIKSELIYQDEPNPNINEGIENKEYLKYTIANLNEGVCWFFLKARNKSMAFDELLDLLEREKFHTSYENWLEKALNRIAATNYMLCLGDNFLNKIYRLKIKSNDRLMLEISDEATELIKKKLNID